MSDSYEDKSTAWQKNKLLWIPRRHFLNCWVEYVCALFAGKNFDIQFERYVYERSYVHKYVRHKWKYSR